jgi:hypothetical protein
MRARLRHEVNDDFGKGTLLLGAYEKGYSIRWRNVVLRVASGLLFLTGRKRTHWASPSEGQHIYRGSFSRYSSRGWGYLSLP